MPPKRFQKKPVAQLHTESSAAVAAEYGANDHDVDYMASDFVAQSEKKRSLEAAVPPPTKKLTVRMAESREEGLGKELGSDNLGFKMLSKMGFRAGNGLGPNEAGRTEPVKVTMPGGRGGLGRTEEEKRREDAAFAAAKAEEVTNRGHWQEHQKQRFRLRRLSAVAAKAALAVRALDESAGLPRSELWPAEDDENEAGASTPSYEIEDGAPPLVVQVALAPDGSEYARPTGGLSTTATKRGGGSSETGSEPAPAELEARLVLCVAHLQREHGWSLLHGCTHADLESRSAGGAEAPATAEEEVAILLEEQ
jgi:hypothetical protein